MVRWIRVITRHTEAGQRRLGAAFGRKTPTVQSIETVNSNAVYEGKHTP
jgi:hypothetical protein